MNNQDNPWRKVDMLQEILDAVVHEFFHETDNPEEHGDKLKRFLQGEVIEGDARLLLFPPNEDIKVTRWTFIKAVNGIIENLTEPLPPDAVYFLEKQWGNDVDVLFANPYPSRNTLSNISDAKDGLIRVLNDYYYFPGVREADFLSICVIFFGKSIFSYLREEGLIAYKMTKNEMDDIFYSSLRKLESYMEELQCGFSRFFKGEFDTMEAEQRNLSVLRLCKAIKADMPNFTFTSRNALQQLNSLLEMPSLYHEIREKKPRLTVSRVIESRHEEIRKKAVRISNLKSDLPSEKGGQDLYGELLRHSAVQSELELKDLLRRLNRLLLEEVYTTETPTILGLTDDERGFIHNLATALYSGYGDYIKKEGVKKKDAELVTSMVSPQKWKSIIENMILKDAVMCPYNYKGDVCGKLFLRSKGSNRPICYEHSKLEYQRFIRALKPPKKRGGFRPGSGRPRKG